jgi:molecular chaperone IbpA
MRTYDLSPLFRSTVGFDRMMRFLDAATRVDEAAPSYPPHNIEKTGENTYRITMAVAGFAENELNITVQEGVLIVSAKSQKDEKDDAEPKQYLHRGIARRAFERRFELADHIQVTGATLANGLLHVELKREVPEAARPRTVEISSPRKAQAVESRAA